MKPKKKVINRISCFFGYHDYEAYESKKVVGFLFGGIAESNHYKCKNCNKDHGWTTTESFF